MQQVNYQSLDDFEIRYSLSPCNPGMYQGYGTIEYKYTNLKVTTYAMAERYDDHIALLNTVRRCSAFLDRPNPADLFDNESIFYADNCTGIDRKYRHIKTKPGDEELCHVYPVGFFPPPKDVPRYQNFTTSFEQECDISKQYAEILSVSSPRKDNSSAASDNLLVDNHKKNNRFASVIRYTPSQ